MDCSYFRGAKTATTSGRLPVFQPAKLQSSAFLRGQRLLRSHSYFATDRGPRSTVKAVAEAAAPSTDGTERLRLNNLAPQPGARRKNLRKGRGYGAGQGGSCGFGMRGQKSRSGSGTKPGFEGGQMPLYRRLPKLRGIAGGMSAGVPKFVTVNLKQLSAFKQDEEVSLESLQRKRILKVSGKATDLPLKVLGDGTLPLPLTIKAESFSDSAKEKIEKAGGKMVEIPRKLKWTRAIGRKRAAEKAKTQVKASSAQSKAKSK